MNETVAQHVAVQPITQLLVLPQDCSQVQLQCSHRAMGGDGAALVAPLHTLHGLRRHLVSLQILAQRLDTYVSSVAKCRSCTPACSNSSFIASTFCRGFVTASHLQRFEKLFPARRWDHTEVFSLCGRRKGEGADESFEKS